MATSRNSIVAGVIVLAAAVGFLAWKGVLGYPPKGTEGSIGAAKRYQAEQISPADVQLNDPQTQAFIQSDLFHRMQTDADFRKAVVDGSLDRYASAQAYATDLERAASGLRHSAETAKQTAISAKALAVAALADALANQKDLALMADAEKQVIELLQAAIDLGLVADLEQYADVELVADLERCTEELAHFSDVSRGLIVADRATALGVAARDLEKAAIAEKVISIAKMTADVAERAEELARRKGSAKVTDVERLIAGVAKMADEVAKSSDAEMLADVEKMAHFARCADNLVRISDDSRSVASVERASAVEQQAREIEKQALEAKEMDVAHQAADVAEKAEELARLRTDAGKAIALERANTALMVAATELAKSLAAGKIVGADASARSLARVTESFARVTHASRTLDAVLAFRDLGMMIDAGKFKTAEN